MSWQSSNLSPKKHCFFGAEGGVSQGKYASLNTNYNSLDSKVAVRQNFEIITAFFKKNYEDMFTLNQGVSNKVVEADLPQQFSITADGAVTTNPNILLGIKTADCAPVLLADYKHGVIGAAHAGWRGAYKGVVENTISLMQRHGAVLTDIAVAIGPCMQQASFEVAEDMKACLLAENLQNEKYFHQGKDAGHFYFDLSGYLEDKIKRQGIDNVINSRIDTYPAENGYFSYRRNTHLRLIEQPRDYPTQYSFICL